MRNAADRSVSVRFDNLTGSRYTGAAHVVSLHDQARTRRSCPDTPRSSMYRGPHSRGRRAGVQGAGAHRRRDRGPCRSWSTTSSSTDDASPDETAERARAAADGRTVVITLPQNQGVGGAVLTGHRAALDRGADVCVVMAGDGQMDPDYLPALLDPIADGRAQFTKANRFYGRGSFEGMPRIPRRRQHRPLVPHQGGERLLEPLRPAERLHRHPPRRSGPHPVGPDRTALRLRERPAHQPQHPARARCRRAGAGALRRARSRG